MYRLVKSIDMFLDGPDAKARDAVHVCFAAEKDRPDNPTIAPDVTETVKIRSYNTLSFEALVRMKLNSFRDKDRMHLRDMLDVELIDDTWPVRYPAKLADRLQQLINDPEG